VLIGVPVLYVASIGPACRLRSSGLISYDRLNRANRPLVNLAFHGPEIVQGFLKSYVELWDGGQTLLIAHILDNST